MLWSDNSSVLYKILKYFQDKNSKAAASSQLFAMYQSDFEYYIVKPIQIFYELMNKPENLFPTMISQIAIKPLQAILSRYNPSLS